MKPIVKYALVAAGAVVLSFGSFVTFAALSGAPLHEVAVLKHFVTAPPDGSEPGHEADKTVDPLSQIPAPIHEGGHDATQAGGKGPSKFEARAIEANVGVLSAFMLPSPLSANELSDLQRSLRETNQDARQRLERIAHRERELEEWEHALGERREELAELRRLLERKELDISLREDELKRDEDSKNARDQQSWAELAKFFSEGDPEELAHKLVLFEPKEAVRILRALDDERAGALVNALPADKYHAYLQAYRETPK